MDKITFLHDNLCDAALELGWRQWTAAGLAGVREGAGTLIDPEALLLASLTLGRYDARLFDEILDWLVRNSRLLDLARLRRLSGRAAPSERRLLGTAARLVAERGGAANLERLLVDDQEGVGAAAGVEREPLFYSHKGEEAQWGENDPFFAAAGFLRSPVQLRGLSGRPKAANPACLRFQLRALVGLGSRAEVLTYLLTHEWAHGRLIAERTAYGQAPVALYLASLLEVRLVDRREEGKKVLYQVCGTLREAVPARPLFVDWIRVWPALTAALEALRPTRMTEEARWVRLAATLAKHEPAFRTEGFAVEIGDLRGWALQGPDILATAVENVTAKVAELAV